MADESITQHILPEDLTDYFAAILPEGREIEIEEHLAECAACTERARQLHALTHVWDSWTADAHGKAYAQTPLATALRQALAQTPDSDVRARLQRWQAASAGRAWAAVRLVWGTPDRAVRLVTEGLEALVVPGREWEFALATGAVRVRGGRGRGATRTRGSMPLTPNKPQARLQVRGTAQQELVIHVEGLPPGPTPLVLLMPMQGGLPPQVTELERPQKGASYHLARFPNVTPGDYVVAFEPLEPSGA